MSTPPPHFPARGLEQLGHGPSFRSRLIDMLHDIVMLRDFGPEELNRLADVVQAFHIQPGVRLIEEGKRSGFVCFVVEGRLDAVKENGDGEERLLAEVRPGRSIGEMSLIDGHPHSASVVAATDATLLLLTHRGFERLQQEQPRVAGQLTTTIARMMSQRLRRLSGLLVDYLDV